MVYIYYPLLLILFFWGAKVCKKGEWHDDVLAYAPTKAFLGFAAILIIFHHTSQRTCAPWLDPYYIHHGLDAFVYVGYLCVAVFFFFSGYGMYTSSQSKPDFFKGYLVKRILPLLIPAVVMWLVFFAVENAKGMHMEPPLWINVYDYIWYIPAMLYLYIAFYISFKLIKNDRAGVIVLFIATIIYALACLLFSPGTWWYNTPHLFIIGVVVARHREGFLNGLKKLYPLWIALMLIITATGFAIANYYYQIITAFGGKYDDLTHFWVELFGQSISAVTFAFLVVLIGLKVKIGNRVLAFLGAFTLEIYLVHPLFVQLFGFCFMRVGTPPLYHIENQFLYVLAVIVPAIPIAYGLHWVVSKICKKQH